MLGRLPRTLEVGGKPYAIRADWRNILTIISAYNSAELKDNEKIYICLRRMYKDFQAIPQADYPAAYEAVMDFISCHEKPDKPGPRLVDWEKDEQLIFPAINAAAGREVRDAPDMHWWTFLGFFQSIDPESLWGTVLNIRHKRARHRKLEKHEQQFYNANRKLCDLVSPEDKKKAAYDYMEALFAELRAEGSEQ